MPDFMEALDYLSKSLDKPGRAVRGLISGNTREGLAAIPFSDAMGLTDPSQSVSGRGLLEQAGIIDKKPVGSDGFDVGDVAGFGTELALDPLNWAGGTLFKKVLGAGKLARESNAFRDTLLAAGGRPMPEELAKTTKVLNEAGQPLRTYHGTPRAFDEFNKARMDPLALFGPGIYTTDSPEIASEYALKGATSPKLEPRAPQSAIVQHMRDAINSGLKWETDDPSTLATMAKQIVQEPPFLVDQGGDWFKRLQGMYDMVGGSPQNVRMQYIHAANPFVAGDVPYDTMAMASKLRTAKLPQLEWMSRPNDVSRILPELLRKPKLSGDEFLDALKGVNPENVPVLLQHLGYDAIQHGGGLRAGGGKLHQVTIAFNPSQIYDPYVLPAFRQVPSVGPLASSILGYNATRFGQQRPQE